MCHMEFLKFEVKCDIDADGILLVTSIDKGIGKKQDIAITGASTLPSDKVRLEKLLLWREFGICSN